MLESVHSYPVRGSLCDAVLLYFSLPLKMTAPRFCACCQQYFRRAKCCGINTRRKCFELVDFIIEGSLSLLCENSVFLKSSLMSIVSRMLLNVNPIPSVVKLLLNKLQFSKVIDFTCTLFSNLQSDIKAFSLTSD